MGSVRTGGNEKGNNGADKEPRICVISGCNEKAYGVRNLMCHEHHYSCPVYPAKPRFYQHDGNWWADIRNHPAGKKGVRKMLKIRYLAYQKRDKVKHCQSCGVKLDWDNNKFWCRYTKGVKRIEILCQDCNASKNGKSAKNQKTGTYEERCIAARAKKRTEHVKMMKRWWVANGSR